jgi:hypothetical protein
MKTPTKNPMTKTYEVKLMKPMQQYTAYSGTSGGPQRRDPSIHLILLCYAGDCHVDSGKNSPLYTVTDGMAVAEGQLTDN